MNKWTGWTIGAVIVGCIVAAVVGFALTHRPVQPIWVLAIGGVAGAAVVQVIHRKRDPFTAGFN